jgi:drug/metabolite transporter (DMT)-like permease
VTAERRGVLAIAGAALLWSSGGVGIKAVAAPPLKIACYRSAVAAVTLLLVFRPRLPRRGRVPLATVVCYAGCLATFVVATKWTTAANAIFLQYSGVVWVLLLAPLVVGEPYRPGDAVAVTVALGGMALFFVGQLDAGGRAGNAVALVSGLFFGAEVLLLRRAPGTPAETAVIYGNVLNAVALAPFVIADPGIDARSGTILVLLGTCQLAGGVVLFVRGLRHVRATHASLVGMLEPIANPLWVFLVLGESPSRFALLGGGIVLAAIAARTLLVVPAPPPGPLAAPD